MEEMEPSPQYVRGFNIGYQIAKTDPKLYMQLEKSLDRDNEYIHGMKMGRKQLDREKLLEQQRMSQQKTKGRER